MSQDGNLKYEITNETSLTDVAGNRLADHSVATIVSTYVIDTTAPVAPTTVDLNAASDTVSVAGSVTVGTTTDNITNDTTPTVQCERVDGRGCCGHRDGLCDALPRQRL